MTTKPTYPTAKAIRKRNRKLLRLFDEGLPLNSIGKKFHLTRERVRQIAKAFRRVDRSVSRCPEIAVRKALRDLQKRKIQAKKLVASYVIDAVSALWIQGLSAGDLSRYLLKYKVLPRYRTLNRARLATYICILRKKYPTKFPYRVVQGGHIKTAKIRHLLLTYPKKTLQKMSVRQLSEALNRPIHIIDYCIKKYRLRD